MRIGTAVCTVAAGVLGLVTYEVVTLGVAALALAIAILSLVQGRDNRRDLKALVANQSRRAGELVEGLEDDLASGD